MKKIEGLNLKTILEETSTNILKDKERQISAEVRSLVYKQAELQKTKQKCERDADKAQKKLDKVAEKLSKINAGDWSVLEEENAQVNEKNDEKNSQENKLN